MASAHSSERFFPNLCPQDNCTATNTSESIEASGLRVFRCCAPNLNLPNPKTSNPTPRGRFTLPPAPPDRSSSSLVPCHYSWTTFSSFDAIRSAFKPNNKSTFSLSFPHQAPTHMHFWQAVSHLMSTPLFAAFGKLFRPRTVPD